MASTFSEGTSRPIRSALFVDFDNIFLTLQDLDERIARVFATRPQGWISWLENSLPSYAGMDADTQRNILIRRCYLNPEAFGRYRQHFTRSAFETVDCPPLTSQGKNSTDIRLVVDALDALNHKVTYDEFIIMSTDSDYRPILLKLREWDRRTVILAVGAASSAYLRASDHVIDYNAFIEEALGIEEPSVNRRREGSTEKDYSRLIKEFVGDASEPISMAKLASLVQQSSPNIVQSKWLGHGSFKQFLEHLNLDGLKLLPGSPGQPGYVYDPSRHVSPTEDKQIEYEWFNNHPDKKLASFARKINNITNIPCLSPEHYATFFDNLASEINKNGINVSETSKTLQNQCKVQGIPVGRQHINIILRGIAFTGHKFGNSTEKATILAELFYKSALALCENTQPTLSDKDKKLLYQWLCKAASKTSPSAQPKTP